MDIELDRRRVELLEHGDMVLFNDGFKEVKNVTEDDDSNVNLCVTYTDGTNATYPWYSIVLVKPTPTYSELIEQAEEMFPNTEENIKMTIEYLEEFGEEYPVIKDSVDLVVKEMRKIYEC